MEFFDWVNVVQIFTQYFTVVPTQPSAAEYGELLRQILLISVGVAGGIYLICLIFGGIGMTAMAKKVGMKHSWLAFLPLANTWYAGKLAGETQLFGKKMKRIGLYAMLAELACIAINVFALVVRFGLYQPGYFVERYNDSGTLISIGLDTERIPVGLRWLVTANIVCEVLNYIAYIALIFFLCVLFYAFFRKYYARGPFLMTFMCAVLPLRGFVIFAVRNNTPVDYNAYMRKKMEQYARARQQADPYGGYGQGGYDAYGNQTNSGAGNDDPFSDFGDAPAPSDGGGQDASSGGGQTNGGGKDNDPFPDF